MTVSRYRTQLRIPDSRTPDGYYYWTNAFLWNDAIQPDFLLAKIRMRGFWEQCHLSVVQMWYQQDMIPATSGVWVTNPTFGLNHGAYPVEGGYSPFMTVYLRHLIGDVQVGYSRLRMPVLAQDVEGVRLHQDLIDHIELFSNFYLVEAGVCNLAGNAIERFEVNPVVSEWQYRDGTKRRDRVFFGHP